MAIVRYVLDPSNPPKLTVEEKAALDALTDEEITAAAQSDPDNPPLTGEELERIRLARDVKHIRASLGLSQDAFAERYGIPASTLRQWELGRRMPDQASLSYLRVIAALPDQVAIALHAA